MIIYKCRFTGDEMCSDAFKPGPVLDADGKAIEGLMQIQSQKVNKVRSCVCVCVCVMLAGARSVCLRTA